MICLTDQSVTCDGFVTATMSAAFQVYESGSVYDPKVLDITDADLSKTVTLGIQRIAAACLALNYPTLASIPHSVINGYKNVLAVSVETEYTFPLAQKVRVHRSEIVCCPCNVTLVHLVKGISVLSELFVLFCLPVLAPVLTMNLLNQAR